MRLKGLKGLKKMENKTIKMRNKTSISHQSFINLLSIYFQSPINLSSISHQSFINP